MLSRYPHIWTSDTRCWCAPSVVYTEQVVPWEIFPGTGLFTYRKVHDRTFVHFDPAHRPGRPGANPKKPIYPM